MFNFCRVDEGTSEIWEIVLAEDVSADFTERFGLALRFTHREESKYHQMGYLAVIPSGTEETSKILLCCKGRLTENEKRKLYEEMELLLGKSVYKGGAEEAEGWFLYDELSVL
ncbi:MAG: hypothetical protein WC581_03405 [Thermodesulfovibrionales bacterium]